MGDYSSLAAAALLLLVVLIACYMALQLYNLRKPNVCDGGAREPATIDASCRSRFMGSAYYSPSCSSEWLGRRRSDCRGLTTGMMPSIDMFGRFGNGIGCGRLGVPP